MGKFISTGLQNPPFFTSPTETFSAFTFVVLQPYPGAFLDRLFSLSISHETVILQTWHMSVHMHISRLDMQALHIRKTRLSCPQSDVLLGGGNVNVPHQKIPYFSFKISPTYWL